VLSVIEELSVTRSERFSVNAFVMLTRACKRLRTVNLRRCKQLDDYANLLAGEELHGLGET
jgi:hypothetical protein